MSRFGGKEKGRADKRKRDTIELSSSDYDNKPQMKKNFIAKLDEVLEEMKYLRRNLTDVMKLMKGIFSSLQDLTVLEVTFRCSVCSFQFKPPIIFVNI